MAQTKIPDPLTRRHLVERPLAEDKARRLAEAYLAEERWIEAVDFLAKGADQEGLGALRKRAVESGDLFLLRAVVRATRGTVARDEWLALADAAERAGKQRYAADARRQAERNEG